MSTFGESLREFDRLLDGVANETLQTHRDLIERVCKKLSKSKRSSASSVIDALANSQQKIQKYVEQSVADALRCPVNWDDVDLRIRDIQLGISRQDMTTKFRKGLAERALASQFHEWEIQEFGKSKLSDLLENPGTGKDDNNVGNMVKFIEHYKLPLTECVKKGIQHGTRLLLLEGQIGTPSCSVVLFFAFAKFRAVKHAEVEELAKSMRETVWISELIEEVETWFQECLTAYNDKVKSRRHKRKQSAREEETPQGSEKRGRAYGGTLTQVGDCNAGRSQAVTSSQPFSAHPRRYSSEAPAEFTEGRSPVTEVGRPHTHESGRALSLATSGQQHADATITSRQPELERNPPSQWSSSAYSSTQAPLVTNSPLSGVELMQRQGTTVLNAPVTAKRYIDSFDMAIPLSNQAGSATPGTVGSYTLQGSASLHEAMQRPEVGISSLPPLLGPNQEQLDYQFQGVQYLEHQLQPNMEPRRQQDVANQTAISRASTNNCIQMTPDEVSEALFHPGPSNRPEIHVQSPVPMTQGHGWDGTSYSGQGTILDQQYWLTHFPPCT